MAKRQVDAFKAKQRKQKIIAAILGVLFLGIVGFQAPGMWKRLNPPAAPAATPETTPTPSAGTPTGTPSLVAPTLSGAGASPAPATSGSGSLVSGPAPVVQEGQLASFSRFASKDPFAQQLSDAKDDSPSAGGSGGSGSLPKGGGEPPVTGKEPTPGSAVISVNGTLYTVPVGTDFPQASPTDSSIVPLFHLISTTAHTAKISIVGGSYSSGAPSVTLRENKPVTLMNTADGTRYKLILKPVGTSVAAPTAPTTTTSTTVTVPPPSP
jgi:hypothetical protein